MEFARDFQASTAYRPVPPEFFERIVAESLKLPPRLWRLAIDRLVEYDDTQQLARIEAPTLLLWGDHDALFSRTEQDRFMAGAAGRAIDGLRGNRPLPELGAAGAGGGRYHDFHIALLNLQFGRRQVRVGVMEPCLVANEALNCQILVLIPGLSNVAWRQASDLR